MKLADKELQRIKRHRRVRRKITGTAERPRLSVHRSKRGFVCQVIDDIACRTLISFSTQDKKFKDKSKTGGNVEAAKTFGKLFAEDLKAKGITKVAFDRGGLLYHGRIKALADALREGGIQF